MRKIFILFLLAFGIGILPVNAQKKSATAKKPATATKAPQKKGTTTQKNAVPAAKTVTPNSKAGMMEASKIDTFKRQVTPLVKFFESSLNFLADPRNSVNEKQTILSRSYLKWCWDEKVQVEDDLDENRLVPLYKDIPAYLSDVSFFFKSAVFGYSVQEMRRFSC